jgi:hypothetical protein
VSLNEPITSLTLSNLALVTTGSVFGSLSAVVDLGGAQNWEVTVTGVGGNGLLGLRVANGAGIYDLLGNPYLDALPSPDEYYTVSVCATPGQVSNPTPANTALVPSSTSQLSWSTSTNTLNYHVTFDGVQIGTTTGSTFALSPPLSPGTHTWRIDSDSSCGLVTNGPPWSFQVLDASSGPISPSDGALLCSSPSRLEWSAVAGATQYNVWIDDVFQNTVNLNYYDIPLALAEGPHTWYVQSMNAQGALVPSPEWKFVILSSGLINSNVWRTDGQVYAIATAPGVIYIAGNFTYVLSPDNGTWKQRSYIAAIDANTGLPTDFNPKANAPVYALARSGDVLFAGGMFTTMGNLSRTRLAAIDLTSTSSAVLPWDPRANGLVRALYANSSTLYVGGDFTTFTSTLATRNYLAAFDAVATSNTPLPWAPQVSNSVYAITGAGSDIYIGGIFQSAGGQPLHGVAALDVSTGLAHTWANGAADLYVYALAEKNGRLYIGGQFNSMAGQPRRNLACVNPVNGSLFGWNPDADRSVYSLLIDGTTVFAGGNFTQIGTEEHLRLAGMHMITGAAVACNYSVNNVVRALGNTGNTLFAGGDFTQVSSSSATGLAAFGPISNPAPSGVKEWMLYNK